MNERFPSWKTAALVFAASLALSSCAEQPAPYKDVQLSDGLTGLLSETGKGCTEDMLRGLIFIDRSMTPNSSGRRFVAARASETVDVTSMPEDTGSTILLTRNVGDVTTSIAYESSIDASSLTVAGLLSSIDGGETRVASWRNSRGTTAGVKRDGRKTFLTLPIAFNPTPTNVANTIVGMCNTEQK